MRPEYISTLAHMIALPFHPSEAYAIREFKENPGDILREAEKRAENQFGGKAKLNLTGKVHNGVLAVDQGVIAGCAGGLLSNIAEAAAILKNKSTGSGYFELSVYPASMPLYNELAGYDFNSDQPNEMYRNTLLLWCGSMITGSSHALPAGMTLIFR